MSNGSTEARTTSVEWKVDRQIIMQNQVAIMTALLAMKPNNKVEADLYYHIAKTTAYIGPSR